MNFWLCWVFIAGQRLSVAAVRGLITAGASVEAHRLSALGLSCSCGSWLLELAGQELWSQAQLPCSMWNLPGLGIQASPLHWQADSHPLHQQGSPRHLFLSFLFSYACMDLTFCFTQWVISRWCSPQDSGEADLHYWRAVQHSVLTPLLTPLMGFWTELVKKERKTFVIGSNNNVKWNYLLKCFF